MPVSAVAAFAVVGCNRTTESAPIRMSVSVVVALFAVKVKVPALLIFPRSMLLTASAILAKWSATSCHDLGTGLVTMFTFFLV